MKTLSLKEPWVTCIFRHGKRTENRRWLPPSSLIGKRFAIHASKKPEPRHVYPHAAKLAGVALGSVDGNGAFSDGYSGHVVGTAVLAGYVSVDDHGRVNTVHAPSWYKPDDDVWLVRESGNCGWILQDVQLLPEPIPAKGQLGLWHFDLGAHL